ncbi:hypothetical protein [Flavobacterium sp. 14A]|uniref:hypothetical protein n=1 Tax=Flavobacterium sp. 14A TaxID=2735896 RepID=UPI0015713123|nr:hypothetical protein [Flavobacterium sp. 14A]NRT13621.1 hypothetical protein [Flavobacterium sp. 14A]
MESNLIKESIEKERIQLKFYEYLIHYRLSILLFLVAIFSFTNGLQNISTIILKLNNIQTKIGFFFTILSVISFVYQRSRLKLLSVETNEDGLLLIEKVNELAKQKNWSVESQTKDALIIKTNRSYPTSRLFISESGGENVYVFYKPNKILIRSVFDFEKSNGFVVSKGENNENEKFIFTKIKPAANSGLQKWRIMW